MDAEREIVKVYFTNKKLPYLSEMNSGKRIIDFVLFDKDKVSQVEVSCSLTKKKSLEDETLLLQRFEDPSVIQKMKEICLSKNITEYDKILITSINNVSLNGVKIIRFNDILYNVLSDLDTQHYSDGTIRSMQIIKHLLLQENNSIKGLYDNDIIKKKHIRALSSILLSNPDIFIVLNAKDKSIVLNALLEGNENISFDDFPKNKLSVIINALSSNPDARKMMRNSLSEQKNLSSFKKKE
jgi:hypothetical protein